VAKKSVIAQPNTPYIVRFGPYRSHSFVLGDTSPLLSLTPHNAYDILVISTTNKAMTLDTSFRCEISHKVNQCFASLTQKPFTRLKPGLIQTPW